MSKEVVKAIIKEYCAEDIVRDIYIVRNDETVFSIEQTKEEIDISQILKQMVNDETVIVKLFRTIHFHPSLKRKSEYVYELFTFDGNCLKRLEASKDVEIDSVRLPEEMKLLVCIDDYKDWGGRRDIAVYLKEKFEKILGAKIAFYKRIGETFEYWLTPYNAIDCGILYATNVLQDIFKIFGVKKLKIEEHERIYYHPTTSRLFNLKDWFEIKTYELSLEDWDIRNKYIVIQNGDKIEVYVELSKN